MSKLLGCALIVSGAAVAGIAMTLSGDPSEAAVERAGDAPHAAVAAKPAPTEKPMAALPAPAPEPQGPQRKPVTPFHTVTVPNDPVSLSRALQAELRRVGCYEGEINGVWSAPSKRAMKAFTERVNAALPIDKPDYILLSLVQAQPDKVCGSACPSGQVATEQGRCSPAAIVAQAARRAQPPQRVAAVVPPAAEPGRVVTQTSLKPSSAPAPGVPADKAPGWATKVHPVPPAPSASPEPFASDTPRMALAGPPRQEPATATVPTAAHVADVEKPARPHHRVAPRPRERRYSYAPRRRPDNWVRDFFRRIDGGVF